MEQVVSATEARIHFGEIMRRVVETQSPVIVERDGKPQVVVLSMQMYDRLRSGAQDWRLLLAKAHDAIRADLGGRSLPPPEEIIHQMREERDAEILGLS